MVNLLIRLKPPTLCLCYVYKLKFRTNFLPIPQGEIVSRKQYTWDSTPNSLLSNREQKVLCGAKQNCSEWGNTKYKFNTILMYWAYARFTNVLDLELQHKSKLGSNKLATHQIKRTKLKPFLSDVICEGYFGCNYIQITQMANTIRRYFKILYIYNIIYNSLLSITDSIRTRMWSYLQIRRRIYRKIRIIRIEVGLHIHNRYKSGEFCIPQLYSAVLLRWW